MFLSPGPPVSSTNKTDCHDITEILLKVALNTIKQTYTCILNIFKFVIVFPLIWDRHNLFKGEAYLMIMTIKRETWEANASKNTDVNWRNFFL